MEILAPIALLLLCLAFIFWPQQHALAVVEKTRVDYLRERKETVYENLRDLNFEFRAGKYPTDEYEVQRASLESEAATILAEIDSLT
jgi:hypothetical protein